MCGVCAQRPLLRECDDIPHWGELPPERGKACSARSLLAQQATAHGSSCDTPTLGELLPPARQRREGSHHSAQSLLAQHTTTRNATPAPLELFSLKLTAQQQSLASSGNPRERGLCVPGQGQGHNCLRRAAQGLVRVCRQGGRGLASMNVV